MFLKPKLFFFNHPKLELEPKQAFLNLANNNLILENITGFIFFPKKTKIKAANIDIDNKNIVFKQVFLQNDSLQLQAKKMILDQTSRYLLLSDVIFKQEKYNIIAKEGYYDLVSQKLHLKDNQINEEKQKITILAKQLIYSNQIIEAFNEILATIDKFVIKAEKLTFYPKSRQIKFLGDVNLFNNDINLKIQSQELIADYQYFKAIGSVKMFYQDINAKSTQAFYQVPQQLVQLIGDAFVSQKGTSLQGGIIQVDLQNSKVTIQKKTNKINDSNLKNQNVSQDNQIKIIIPKNLLFD